MRCAAVAVAAVAAAAATAGSSRPPLPPYLGASQFGIATNRHWEGSKEVGDAFSTTSKDRSRAIWARTCKLGEQEARFRRTVELLGPPVQARLDWGFYPRGLLRHFEFRVNGQLVVRASEDGEEELAPADLSRFRSGPNILEIRAVKRATDARTGTRCDAQLEVRLSGTFRTDLVVGNDDKTQYLRSGQTLTLEISVRNASTTRAVGGRWHFYANRPTVQGAIHKAPRGWRCAADHTPGLFRWNCTFANFPPRRREIVAVDLVLERPEEPFYEESTSVGWSVQSDTNDRDVDDNSGSQGIVICGSLARPDECRKLPR